MESITPTIIYSEDLHGKFVFEYDNRGNMVGYYGIQAVTKKTNLIVAYKLQFKTTISAAGKLTVVKDTRQKNKATLGRGKKLTMFFIGTDKTKYDYSIFTHRNQIINYVKTCVNIDELTNLYGQIKGFGNNNAGGVQPTVKNTKKNRKNERPGNILNTANN